MHIDISDLTTQEKIGQMMIVGIDKNYVTERTKRLILEHKVGGFILYTKNFNNYEELINLITELKRLNSINRIPLFISIDQEGGRVNRLPREFIKLPSAFKLSKSKNIEFIKKSAEITGKILKKSGINMNFAPVLDIKRFSDGHAIGDRSFGENKEDVIKYGIPVMEELQKQGVVAVIKHFPGHGATKKDSHYFLPTIDLPIEKLEKDDMEIFENAIKQGADAILVGHLRIKGRTGIYPASLSKNFINESLRKKYDYKGLIISDDLKMKSVKLLYGPYISAKKAFCAGNDIIVFRFSKYEENIVINKILKLAKNNKISQIDESVKRIIDIKQKYNLDDNEKIVGVDIDKINNEIIEIRKKTGLDL